MRRALPFVSLLVLAACFDGGVLLPAEPPGAPTAAPQVHVGFAPGGLADAIVVDAVERLPLRAADLISPGGPITPASSIDTDATPRFAAGQRVAADPWRSTLSGSSGPTLSMIQNEGAGAAYQSRQQLLATVSNATIVLPDPVAYRRDWQRYRVRLVFGNPPGDSETRLLPAPGPPPR